MDNKNIMQNIIANGIQNFKKSRFLENKYLFELLFILAEFSCLFVSNFISSSEVTISGTIPDVFISEERCSVKLSFVWTLISVSSIVSAKTCSVGTSVIIIFIGAVCWKRYRISFKISVLNTSSLSNKCDIFISEGRGSMKLLFGKPLISLSPIASAKTYFSSTSVLSKFIF